MVASFLLWLFTFLCYFYYTSTLLKKEGDGTVFLNVLVL